MTIKELKNKINQYNDSQKWMESSYLKDVLYYLVRNIQPVSNLRINAFEVSRNDLLILYRDADDWHDQEYNLTLPLSLVNHMLSNLKRAYCGESFHMVIDEDHFYRVYNETAYAKELQKKKDTELKERQKLLDSYEAEKAEKERKQRCDQYLELKREFEGSSNAN